MPKPTILVATVEKILRAAEDAPALQETEVSKTEAMRRLMPAIMTMRAKGYRLAPIASLLSDNGVAVTEVSLKHYLHRLGGSTATRSPKGDRGATGSSSKVARDPRPIRHGASAFSPKVQQRDVPATPTSPLRTSAISTPVPIESPRRATTSQGTVPTLLYAGFTPRPDTEDI
jgi:hypothetical protein